MARIKIKYGRSATGQIVGVKDALRGARYTCPTCDGLLELRRGEQLEYFAHWRNLCGTQDCELFSPDDTRHARDASTTSRKSFSEVEDDPSELGLLLAHEDGRWGLGLRLPEVPTDELGDTSLRALASAFVDVYAGCEWLTRVSALELRPGVGTARVEALPSLQAFRARPAGSWPATIDADRWSLAARALEAEGNLFRLRCGEWTRLVARSDVHRSEVLLVLADARFPPPDAILCDKPALLTTSGERWSIWEVQLPPVPDARVTSWLARLGHELLPRPWTVDIALPPRAYGEDGEPVFWVGDCALLTLEAPQRGATATVSSQSGSNEHSASVAASQQSVAHVGVKAPNVGTARITVAGERSASLEIAFSQHPSRAEILEQVARTPRLRLHIGTYSLEAWRGAEHRVRVPLREHVDVRVDLGAETARARVTLWERGKQRARLHLNAAGVERAICDGLATASRIEVDADNLGRVVVLPAHVHIDAPCDRRAADRLAWRDEVASPASRNAPSAVAALVDAARGSGPVVRRVGPAALVRARLALRRRTKTGGSRK